MNKDTFLTQLANALLPVPEAERAEALHYYREYIEEAVAEGRSEEDVVASLDSPSVIAAQLRTEVAFTKAAEAPTPRNTSRALAAVFGVLSLPITLPLAIVIIAVALIIGVVALAVIITFAAAIIAVVAAALAVGVRSVAMLFLGAVSGSGAVFTVGMALVGLGLAILLAMLFVLVIRGVCRGLGRFFHWVVRKIKRQPAI